MNYSEKILLWSLAYYFVILLITSSVNLYIRWNKDNKQFYKCLKDRDNILNVGQVHNELPELTFKKMNKLSTEDKQLARVIYFYSNTYYVNFNNDRR